MKTRFLFLLPLLFAWSVQAGDIADLNRNLPLEMEDARPTDAGGVELQLSTNWRRSREGADSYLLLPQLQWGFARDAHLQVATQGQVGDTDPAGNWDLQIGALYRFLGDDQAFSLAVYGELDLPTGIDNAGLDTELKLIASQPIGPQSGTHFNLAWVHNPAPAEGERPHGFRAALGGHHKFSDRWMIVADVARNVAKTTDEDVTLVELGAVTQIGQALTTSLGLSAGLGQASPRTQVTLGLQYSLGN